MIDIDPQDAKHLLCLTEFENGRNAAIMPFMFTWAIIADLTRTGYEDRWCYETLQDAIAALSEWNGEGEPEGWHRHPTSGRRRTKEGKEAIYS